MNIDRFNENFNYLKPKSYGLLLNNDPKSPVVNDGEVWDRVRELFLGVLGWIVSEWVGGGRQGNGFFFFFPSYQKGNQYFLVYESHVQVTLPITLTLV